MSVELRPYQRAAVDRALAELQAHRATLLVAATGTGKTTIFCEVARRFPGRVLILAHREELIAQAARRVAQQTGLSVGVEMADQRIDLDNPPDVVVATVQTLARDRRRALLAPDLFGLVIVDEAHHATARTYRAILEHFCAAKILGVTATPDRGDGTAMRGVFSSIAYAYEIRDAIAEGYLCPIRQKAIQLQGLDLARVRTTAGDLNEGDLEHEMLAEAALAGVVRGVLDEAGDRPTMIFGVTVAHARRLAELLNAARPGSARALDGTTDRGVRRETLADFAAGRFQYLANCALFTEGFDEPSIACVAVARPTKSRAFYAQMAGRGTRLHPGKRDLLLLDFQGSAGRHSLVSPLDILGGSDSEPVKRRAAALCAAEPELSILDALREAERRIARETIARARYAAVEIDPFLMMSSFLGIETRASTWSLDGPRAEDLAFLAEHAKGLDVSRMGGHQVADIAAAIRTRLAAGRSTWHQARCLARAGLNPDVDREVASRAVLALSQSEWKATPALRSAFPVLNPST